MIKKQCVEFPNDQLKKVLIFIIKPLKEHGWNYSKSSKSELIIFSGAIDHGVNDKDKQYLKVYNIPTISIFEICHLGVLTQYLE